MYGSILSRRKSSPLELGVSKKEFMNNKQKRWLLIGPAVFSFAVAMTSPVIQIYFMRLIDSTVLAISNMLAVGIMAVVNTSITKENFLRWYDKHFTFIVVTDVLSFIVVSCAGMEMATARFVGMALINAISTTLWVCVMRNSINHVIDGEELTIWQSLSNSYELYASLAGGLIILALGTMDIEIAIAIECTANLFMGLTDLKARKLLTS